MYNLVKRQAEVELLPMALSEKLGVVCYNPIGGGLLSGKYINTRSPAPGRFHEDNMYKSRYREPWMHETAKRFFEFSEENGFHPVSLAVAWVAHHPAVTAPIIGARNVEQLEDSLNALKVQMTHELYSRISALSPKPPPPDDRTEDPGTKRNP
jgi:aryl-alcohol dehydrogenase-like predicted oxidoreductase